MRIDELHAKDLLALCERAERECVQCFRALYRRLNRGERDLRFLLLELAEEEEDHAAELERMGRDERAAPGGGLDDAAAAQLIREHFPAFSGIPEPGELDPERVTRILCSIEEQSARFYRSLAQGARGSALSGYFTRVAGHEAGHLASASEFRARIYR